MVTWNNLDKLASFEELKKVERVNLAEVQLLLVITFIHKIVIPLRYSFHGS